MEDLYRISYWTNHNYYDGYYKGKENAMKEYEKMKEAEKGGWVAEVKIQPAELAIKPNGEVYLCAKRQ